MTTNDLYESIREAHLVVRLGQSPNDPLRARRLDTLSMAMGRLQGGAVIASANARTDMGTYRWARLAGLIEGLVHGWKDAT